MKRSKKSKPDHPQRSLASSLMAQNQLIDSLTSHISLYSSRPISADSNPSPRSSIIKWFSSLSLHQRQAHLTTIDAKFVRILVEMLGKVRTKGHGCFIILPDIPSGDLPSVCYKKSRGLISRVSESNEYNRFIFQSIRLFNSREGEQIEDCSCSVNCLDTFTVSDNSLENVDRFVDIMDNVSNGAFLRGEGCDLALDWLELDWLKAKGYYSIEAFIANRLEVRLRLAWLNSIGGKRRGVKFKEKLNATAMATSVYWRKKGCLEWWMNLDAATRRKLWTTVLGKSAKFLIRDVLRETNRASEEELWLFGFGDCHVRERYTEQSQFATAFSVDGEFGMTSETASLFRKPRTFGNIIKSLCMLHDVNELITSYQNSEFSAQNVFFSSLDSLSTLSDCILRILRGFLVAVSIDATKLELLEDVNCKRPPTTLKEKVGSTNHKKKGKTRNVKKSNPAPISGCGGNILGKPIEDSSGLENNINRDLVESIKMSTASHAKNNLSAFPVVKDQANSNISGKGKATEKKNRKGRNKKVMSLRTSAEKNSSVVCALSDAMSTGSEHLDTITSACSSPGQPHKEVSAPVVGGSSLVDSAVTLHSSTGEVFNCRVEGNKTVPTINTLNHVDSLSSEDFKVEDSCHSIENKESVLMSNGKCLKKDKPILIQDQIKREISNAASIGGSDSFSREWPAVAPVYFPSVTSHLPTATDRLHLDVGQNLHSYVRQPFVPTVHHARKPSVEGECKQVLPRPLSMSSDWPPVVRGNYGLTASLACNYDSGVFVDFPEPTNLQEGAIECEKNCMSEEEFETHTVSGVDYSQYFGGGVMYWDPSDHLGAGFSRPPSLSSDDSSWAWHEAEMRRAVDDMVAFSSSYSTNGLTSPTAASFCSPFDTLGPGNQPLSYVVPGNEVSSKVLQASATTVEPACEDDVSGSLASSSGDTEVSSGDSFPYPILRPIIIPSMTRERSKSEFKCGYDLKSPKVPTSRRERPYIKRPPSPVVLCVPRAPLPTSPSPASEPRTRRGFSTVRSGSSSPRHWGMRGWLRDAINWEEACGAEVVWPWRNKNLSVRPIIQPLPGALLPDHLIAMSQLARDQEHPDVAFPLQPHELLNCPTRKASLSLMHNLLNKEIDSFCKQVAAQNMARKSYISWSVKRVARSLQVLWPRSRTNIFGSYATGLCLPSSDVDLVVVLPPVRNLEPIKEAGILEGRNGIKETCLQHAARYLANQEWVKSDSLKTVENTAIPIIMLVVEIPHEVASTPASKMQSSKDDSGCASIPHSSNCHSDMVSFEDSSLLKSTQTDYESFKNVKSVRLDISFKTPSHTGLKTTELVKDLTEQFPAATPLALVLKQFLADRSLDQSYSGGLSSYCLVLLITRFLQHQHHLGRPINQNFGSLLMDFLYFFGNVFDPRQMRISVQGSGVYRNRERGHSIDPIHIDDPLCPTNNVGRNCFRIHQCIKAFSEAYSTLTNELTNLSSGNDPCGDSSYRLLTKIIPSISLP